MAKISNNYSTGISRHFLGLPCFRFWLWCWLLCLCFLCCLFFFSFWWLWVCLLQIANAIGSGLSFTLPLTLAFCLPGFFAMWYFTIAYAMPTKTSPESWPILAPTRSLLSKLEVLVVDSKKFVHNINGEQLFQHEESQLEHHCFEFCAAADILRLLVRTSVLSNSCLIIIMVTSIRLDLLLEMNSDWRRHQLQIAISAGICFVLQKFDLMDRSFKKNTSVVVPERFFLVQREENTATRTFRSIQYCIAPVDTFYRIVVHPSWSSYFIVCRNQRWSCNTTFDTRPTTSCQGILTKIWNRHSMFQSVELRYRSALASFYCFGKLGCFLLLIV